MDWGNCELVEVVPGKVSGVPILKGTRVQADTVREAYELGESPEEIAYDFDLKVDDVRRVLAYVAEQESQSLVREDSL